MSKLAVLPFPPEVRNMIYGLLLSNEYAIEIASPLSKHQRKEESQIEFSALLLVNKQTNVEAKTIFFGHNTFIIGNGHWSSTRQANLHALKAFTSRIPKDCLALIREVYLDMFIASKYDKPMGIYHQIRKEEVSQLQTICSALLKYFESLELISLAAVSLEYARTGRYGYVYENLEGDVGALAKPIQKLLALPSLKELNFQVTSARNMKELVEAVLEGNENAKDKVKMVKANGRVVLF